MIPINPGKHKNQINRFYLIFYRCTSDYGSMVNPTRTLAESIITLNVDSGPIPAFSCSPCPPHREEMEFKRSGTENFIGTTFRRHVVRIQSITIWTDVFVQTKPQQQHLLWTSLVGRFSQSVCLSFWTVWIQFGKMARVYWQMLEI